MHDIQVTPGVFNYVVHELGGPLERFSNIILQGAQLRDVISSGVSSHKKKATRDLGNSNH